MKKKNNQGFILLETLIVSAFIIGVLVFLYVQFSNIKRGYDESFRINTITGLYRAVDIKKYLNSVGYDNIKSALSTSQIGYIELNSSQVNGDATYYDELIKYLNVKHILLVEGNMNKFKNYLKNNQEDFINRYTNDFYKYISKVSVNSIEGYRLLIVYNDDTYTSITLD